MSECIICRNQFNATTVFTNQVCSDKCNQLADPKFNLRHYIEKFESENTKLKKEIERHAKRWQELKGYLQRGYNYNSIIEMMENSDNG